MHLFKKLFCVVLLALILPFKGFSEVILYTDTNKNITVGTSVLILEDEQDTLSINRVVQSASFKPNNQEVLNLGLTKSAFWIKTEIKNMSNTSKLLLELGESAIDQVEFYTILPNGKFDVKKAGEYQAFDLREYNHPTYIFDLNIPTGQTETYFIKVKSKEQLQVPIKIGTSQTMFEYLFKKNVVSGIYVGIIIVMILYNLFIYFTVLDKSYLYYVVYIIMVGLTQISAQGYTFQYLWPNFPWLAEHNFFLFPALVGIAGLEFIKFFLHTKEHVSLFWNRLMDFLIAAYVVSIVLALTKQYMLSYKIIQMTAIAVSLTMLFVAILVSRKGYRPATFFLIAWSIFLGGVVIFVMKDIGVLPFNNFTRYTMQAGSAIEVVLLSFGLADRINILKKEKEESQADALRVLTENKRIIEEQNVMLEIKVKERTEDLEASNEELSATMENLKETQSQLVNAEKMASLGQLTAGIAHEINNPINFVSSNVKPLRRDIEDIVMLLNKYDEIKDGNDFDLKLKEIDKLKKELDTKYLITEMSSLLQGIEDGALRTAEIVKGLRNFSRIDESGLKIANIHDGLDSTITLLNNTLKNKIKIIKEYGNLPQIECFPGKLNQFFMNVINNAAQAIFSKKLTEGEGVIHIKTSFDEKNIYVKIKDNGIGMSEEIKQRVFEPFFTTKDVGEGTGLGLSIAYSIIESHSGNIQVESQEGVGTEFLLTLPIVHVPNK